MFALSSVVLIILPISCVKCYPGYWGTPTLNPVHGLYVKPSSDGVTGDLFVAATEDHGVKSQWVVDQPINFLKVAAQPHPATLPSPYPGYPAPHDENKSQKPPATLPVQYAYALPAPSSEGTPVLTYPYTYPIQPNPSETSSTKCDPSASAYPFHFPYQLFYPQMLSAYSNAMTILKDAGLNEDSASSVMAQASPMWPPAPYAYPMYMMVPWTQNQEPTTPASSTSLPQEEEESTQT